MASFTVGFFSPKKLRNETNFHVWSIELYKTNWLFGVVDNFFDEIDKEMTKKIAEFELTYQILKFSVGKNFFKFILKIEDFSTSFPDPQQGHRFIDPYKRHFRICVFGQKIKFLQVNIFGPSYRS